MSFWTGFAGGIQAGSTARSRWDERGGLAGLFGGGETTQAADKPMSDASAAVSGDEPATAGPSPDRTGSSNQPAATARSSSGASPAGFDPIARRLVSDLQQDFGLTREQAAGIAGPLAMESAGFGTLQEVRPLIPGSRGGFGYAQWTGPRRRAFESWSRQKGLDPTSYEANYGFLRHELQNTGEGRVLQSIRGISDSQSAAQAFTNQFLRPGIPNMPARMSWTSRVLGLGPSRDRLEGSDGSARAVTSPTSGDAGDIEPIRVQPGEVEIPPLFANQVAADAGRQINASPEVEGLVSSVRRGAPGLAVTAPAARALRAGEVDSATDPQLVEEDAPPPAPIRGETAELESRAYARGGAGDGAGGRGAVSAVQPAPGLGVQARAVAPRALGPGEVDSATDPQMAARPEGSGTAAGYAGGAAGGRASASATVPGSTPQEAPAPAARPAPRREAPPREEAPPAAPARQTRAQPAAPRPAYNPSERERLMLLRDPDSLAPGEEERLRAGLPQNTLGMPDLMSLFRGRQAAAQTREKAAERTQPAARPAPSAGDPVTTGTVPAAPVRAAPSRAPVGPSGNVQEGDQPAVAPSAPAQRAPDPVPYPEPRTDQERFANGRAAAQAALERGEPPQRIAEGLTAAGVPVEEWPPTLRQVRPAPRRGPVYDAQGQLMPEHGGLTGAAREQAMRTGRAPGIVMVQAR